MSRGFIKEGDQEEIPMVPPRAYLPEGVPNYVTKEGLEALKEEMRALEEKRAKTGDNYIMSNFIDASMKLLMDRISSAVEVDLSKANRDTVSFGAWVRYNGRVVRIVGVDEADVNQGLISFISPLARTLTGKKEGEVFELKGPRGMEKILVEDVSYEPLTLTEIAHDKEVAEPSTQVGASTEASPEKRSQDSLEKALEQIVQAPTKAENEERCPSNEAEGPRRFEPETDPMEFLPIVNERGHIAGRALYMELHKGIKILHPVVHLHVSNGETVQYYWWHVAFGDTSEKTLKRKMEESLGLRGVKPVLKRQYIREAKTEKELVYVFTAVSEEDLPLPPEGKEYNELFAKD